MVACLLSILLELQILSTRRSFGRWKMYPVSYIYRKGADGDVWSNSAKFYRRLVLRLRLRVRLPPVNSGSSKAICSRVISDVISIK